VIEHETDVNVVHKHGEDGDTAQNVDAVIAAGSADLVHARASVEATFYESL
jgi:hypothetical protein